jgi:hypothetical protein
VVSILVRSLIDDDVGSKWGCHRHHHVQYSGKIETLISSGGQFRLHHEAVSTFGLLSALFCLLIVVRLISFHIVSKENV